MGTPAIRLLLFVFIGEDGLKSSSMEVESKHISRGKGTLWESGKEEFVNALIAGDADGGSRRGCRVSSNDDPASGACWSKKDIRTIEEGTLGSRFGMGRLLIRGQGQASLDLWQIEEIIVLATHNIS